MVEAKRKKQFLADIIEKHGIDVDKQQVRSPGEQHTRNCYDDIKAFHSYKADKFFPKETAAKRQPKEATALINYIVEECTRAEELNLLGKYILRYLPPKMQRVYLNKIQHIVKVDYDDPATYVYVDAARYEQRPNAASSKSGDSQPPDSPGMRSRDSPGRNSPLRLVTQKHSTNTALSGLDSPAGRRSTISVAPASPTLPSPKSVASR